MNHWLISIPIAYLLGSIPFGYLLVRFFRHEDIRAIGSGNIGATNVARSGAKGLGFLTLLLDLGKGFVAVRLAQNFAPGVSDLAVAAAVAAILGHVFPVWLGFRGGKGVASALGIFLALSWPSALCILGVFLAIVLLTRYVSLGSILGAAALPMFAFGIFLRGPDAIVVGGFVLISLIVIVKHHANIQRLLSGTENRFGSKSSQKAAA
jgi:glycerol-3-phosphate acyltransferase PlsY